MAVAAIVIAVLRIASPAEAQQAAAPQLFVLHQEMARPSMTQQYEATMKEFIGMVRQHHQALPTVQFIAMAGEDFLYTYITPIENYATLDKVHAGFGVMIPAVGEAKWTDMIVRAGAATAMRCRLISSPILGAAGSFEDRPGTERLLARSEGPWSTPCRRRVPSQRCSRKCQLQYFYCINSTDLSLVGGVAPAAKGRSRSGSLAY